MRASLLAALLGILVGCSFTSGSAINAADVPVPHDSVCVADAYAYYGETTMAALGVSRPSGRAPPDANRVGTIWITADRRFNQGEPPGMAEGRMLCIEFHDGGDGISAMSDFPVVDSWRPPSSVEGIAVGGPVPVQVLLLVLGAVLLLAASFVAFRERR